MISRDVLLTWLSALRLNWARPGAFEMPNEVRIALVENGWIEIHRSCEDDDDADDDDDEEEGWTAHLTESGEAACDLFGPECGIRDARFEEAS